MDRFRWSAIQSAEVLEESRASRFRPEWRETLLGYLGLRPGMRVLEVGCGPGTLAPYLAEGIAPGHVTGVDLDEEFIARAREKAAAAGQVGVRYLVGDAYALPFADGSFDAVTSYTGIGVLEDPRRAIAEMTRVCRPGGPVSVAEAVAGPGGIVFAGIDHVEGQTPYPGAERLRELLGALRSGYPATAPGIGSRAWPVRALWALMAELGLQELELNAWGHVMAADDRRTPNDARKRHRELEHEQLTAWVDELVAGHDHSVLGESELLELRALIRKRLDWSMTAPLWDWEASLSIAALGRKP
jgi:SAM-dependent methyltransferase